MKRFLGFLLASFIGSILGAIVVVLIVFIILSGVGKFVQKITGEKDFKIKKESKNKILGITIDERFVIEEAPSQEGSDFFSISLGILEKERKKFSIYSIINAIKNATKDDDIKGIYLKILAPGEVSLSQMSELKIHLQEFKEKGKFIYGYTSFLVPSYLYFLTICDTLILDPQGFVLWNGYSASLLYLKKLFEKIGITFKDMRGPDNKYKSAVETFTADSMSPYNRAQIKDILDERWNKVLAVVSGFTGQTPEALNNLADTLMPASPYDAMKFKFCHIVGREDFIDSTIMRKFGDDYQIVQLDKYIRSSALKQEKEVTDGDIAILYASGEIYYAGEDAKEDINSEYYKKVIKELDTERNVKAVVIRVVSPGGSALASDIISNEVEKLKKKKPVVISMGSVAASGGYYISCVSDYIVATPFTITGSIGVIGLLGEASLLIKDKLGIRPEVIKTNKYSDIFGFYRKFYSAEEKYVQSFLDSVYYSFVRRVSYGRKLDVQLVEESAKGRIWSSEKALKLGLIDTIGTLLHAIKMAANLAGLEKYNVVEYPKISKWEKIASILDVSSYIFNKNSILLSEFQNIEKEIYSFVKGGRIQYRMPYIILENQNGIGITPDF